MKIAVAGAGGLGGYLGGLLARAGHDVAFLARGEHLRAIREAGLRIESPHGSFVVRPALATDDPASPGTPGFEAELTIFAVKTYDTDVSAKLIRPWVGAHTAVLPLQNGVESVPRLSQYFGPESLLGGAAWIVSAVAAPGVIRQEGQIRRIVFGEQDGADTPRLHTLQDVLAQSGFEVETTKDIEKVLWTKLVFIASFSGISSVTRAPAGPVLASSESRLLLLNALREVEAVARARGIALEPDVVPKAMALAEGLAPGATSSMQRDVVAGRRLEYDAINGAVVRAGQAAGVPTPIHEFLWTCLKIVEQAGGG